jgi:lipoate-protein ligase A
VAGLTLTDWYGIRAFSGALLIDADLETMGAVLTPSAGKLKRHSVGSLAERVTTLRQCGKPTLASEEVMAELVATLAREHKVCLAREPLSTRELEDTRLLQKTKYGHPGWNRTEPLLEAL